ncbi:uncharacterized protein LOC120088933 [Benincasa hispida]|uniref:uncharacterized protein LOC120088933 n=1 Tax=Benincasa hispida TaxID=102211 RepID=UPI001901B174|nr:uncharacterized protein LOC120088933 [Benincasa hispida]
MQQRALSSFRATNDHDHCNIMIFSTPTQEPRGRRSPPSRSSILMDDSNAGLLPISDPRFSTKKRDHNSRYRFAERWIHLIPLILLLILFILWWSSYPVNMVIKDGAISAVYTNDQFPEAPKYIDHVELAVLGDAGMQIASSPLNVTSIGDRDLRIPSKVD